MQMEKDTIIDYLISSGAEVDTNSLTSLSLMDLIDLLVDHASETELDYSILSTAFASRVHPDRFEQFHEAVMNQYESIQDGQEIPESTLDRIAVQYR